MERRWLHGTIPLLVIVTVVFAALLAYPTKLSERFTDYAISVAATTVISTVIVIVPRFRSNIVAVILHLTATLTAFYPLSGSAAATLIIVSAYTFIVGRYYRGFALLVGLIGLGTIFLVLSSPRYAWDQMIAALGPLGFLTVSSLVLTAIAAGGYLRHVENTECRMERDVDRLERSVAYLTEANQSLQRYALNARTTSAQTERNRISREVHDSIGHVLVNIIMMLEAAREYIRRDHDLAESMLRQIRDEADLGHREMRQALRELRSIGEHEGEVTDFHVLLRLTRVFSSATGIDVSLEVGNAGTVFSDDFARLMYSFFQEGFTNAVRHGRATEISIIFHATDDLLRVALRDNGVGIQGTLHEGIGIRGMRERLASCGGTLTIENGPTGLTFVTTVPKRFVYTE